MTHEHVENELKDLRWAVGLLSLAVLGLQKHAGLIEFDISEMARQMLGADQTSRTA